jgi:hypothetical protein
MVSLNDVLLAMSNIPVSDPIAEIWGRQMQGGYKIIEYTGALPITISANGEVLIDYRIYGASGGVGEPTESGEPVGYKLPMVISTQNLLPDNISQFGNGYINTYGSVSPQDTTRKEKYSDYISIAPNTSYTFAMTNGFPGNPSGSLDAMPWRTIAFYRQNKTLIVRSPEQTYDAQKPFPFTVTSPSGAFFVRVSWRSFGSEECPVLVTNRGIYSVYIGDTPLGEDEYVDYGEQKVYKRKTLKDIGDTVSVNGDLWDIVNYNNDFTRATLLRHETMPEMMYSAKQAIFAFPNGLAAGDYHFTIAQHLWVSTDIGKTLTFTLTQAIPDGGQLVFNGEYNVTMVGTTISSYASPTSTTAIETVTMTEGGSGTDLGSLTNAGTPANNINSLQKALLGSNEWKTSAQRQYLNSDQAAGSVWTPQTIYDRPPTWATNTVGFMNGLDEDFLSCVADTTYVTVRNAISDGGGTDTLTDKFYLPSRTEIFGDNEIANTPEGTLYQYYVNATNSDRIKYRANSARAWRLRTPIASSARSVRNVYYTGALINNLAHNALGFAPACQIDLTKLNNSWILANFYKPTLTPTDPPVPLPALPTIDGTTVIDCELADKPSQMYVKYKGKR